MRADVQKYEQNPACPCNLEVYRNVLRLGRNQIAEYFPGREVVNHDAQVMVLAENHWVIINCRIDELEGALRRLSPGRKQLALARHDREATVVINELDLSSQAGELMDNNWSVVNCKAADLEKVMKRLPPGRKQIALARHLDEVTLVINELNLAF